MNREIEKLLADPLRPDSPEPTLLALLARWADEHDLPSVASVTAAVGGLPSSLFAWPVVVDAVAEVLGARVGTLEGLREILHVLPPVAAHLTPALRASVNWDEVDLDALAYAALADEGPDLWELARTRLSQTRWHDAFNAPTRPAEIPRISDAGLLIRLATRPDAGLVTGLWNKQAAYLLPFLSETAITPSLRSQAVEVIADAARNGSGWYTAAVVARVTRYLGDEDRLRIREVAQQLPQPWSGHIAGITEQDHPAWPSAEAELAAAHPTSAPLRQLGAQTPSSELAVISVDAVERIAIKYGPVAAPHVDAQTPPDASASMAPARLPEPVERVPRANGQERLAVNAQTALDILQAVVAAVGVRAIVSVAKTYLTERGRRVRADASVAKTYLTERAKTDRERIRQDGETARRRADRDGAVGGG